MAVTFNIQFRISVATKVIRLTDTSSGFTYNKGCFSVAFPDGSTRNLPSFTNPDLTVAGTFIDIPCVTDISGNVVKGTYSISYAVTDNLSAEQTPLTRSFDFNWTEPTNGITNLSDVLIPEVVFSDVTSYSPIGSFTGVLTRTISSSFPSTSEVSANSPITSTSTNLIRVVYASNYYEGSYTPTSNVSVTYTHSSNAWLTILYTRTFSSTFIVRKTPNQLGLVTKINNYRAIIDAYKLTNDTQFNILSNQYDIVISLYSHLIARYQTSTQDGSEPILRELLSILEPYIGTYSYQATKMLQFEIATSVTNSFNISDGTNVDAVPIGSTIIFASTNAALVPIITDNVVTYAPAFGTALNTFAQGNDSRFHTPVTIGTANGLSISTQALSLAAATSGSPGSMSATDKGKLDGIASGATSNVGTVTSVSVTAPAAFSVTGSPITVAGTIGIAAVGTSAQYITGAGALATLNTANVPENTNLYYTDVRARAAISLTTTGASGASTYNSTTGILNVPNYIGGVTSFNTRTGAIVLSSADVTAALTYTPVPSNRTLTINGTSYDLSADRSWTLAVGVSSFNTRTGAITPTSGDYTTTLVTEGTNLYYTDARARVAISLTTTGTSGSATYSSATGVLNIPAYQGGVTSFNTRTGAITLTSSDITTALTFTPYNATNPSAYIALTALSFVAGSGAYNNTTGVITIPTNNSQITNGANYIALTALSSTALGLVYTNTTGVFSLTAGYSIPNSGSTTAWDTAYTNRITSVTSPLSTAANVLSISQSSGTVNGFLSSTDWTTFNGKQSAGNYITALTGEVTASGAGSVAATLLNSAVISKVLTGLNLVGGGSITDTDTILQAFGKTQNQISALVGGVFYKGVWNASTNTPAITSSTGAKGNYYVVNVAGATSIDGITDWKVGDWIIFNGTAWDKVDNTDAVSSVNGFLGAVSLTTANIPEVTNLYYTDVRARASHSFTAGSGAYNSTTGVITIPTNNSQLTNGSAYIALTSLSSTATGLTYTNTTGVFSLTSTYFIPTTTTLSGTNTGDNAVNSNYSGLVSNATHTGDATGATALTLATVNANVGAFGSGTVIPTITVNAKGLVTAVTTTSIPTATTSITGLISSTDWTTFNTKQTTVSLTTTGTSGAATFSANTLNIPNYGSALSGYLPLSGGTLTGALAGTSATFSSSSSTIFSALTLTNSATVANGNGSLFSFNINNNNGGVQQSAYILGYNQAATGNNYGNIAFYVANATSTATTRALLLDYTGAATFSSSVTTNANFFASSPVPTYILTNASQATTYGYLQHNATDLILLNAISGAIIFNTNSAERMRITSTGNVGIGTTSPNGYQATSGLIHINSSNTNAELHLTNTTCGATASDGFSLLQYFDQTILFNLENNAMLFGTNALERMRITSGGNLLVGTGTDNGYKLTLNGQPGANGYTAWTNYSDRRLKENIEPLVNTSILDKINLLNPVTFNYNAASGYDEETRARRISGFIAQELKEIFPEMVGTLKLNDKEYFDTNLSDLSLYLVKAIQELSAKVSLLENK